MEFYFGRSRFTASNEIMIHKKTTSNFTFHGERIRPFTNPENTLYHPLSTDQARNIIFDWFESRLQQFQFQDFYVLFYMGHVFF